MDDLKELYDKVKAENKCSSLYLFVPEGKEEEFLEKIKDWEIKDIILKAIPKKSQLALNCNKDCCFILPVPDNRQVKIVFE